MTVGISEWIGRCRRCATQREKLEAVTAERDAALNAAGFPASYWAGKPHVAKRIRERAERLLRAKWKGDEYVREACALLHVPGPRTLEALEAAAKKRDDELHALRVEVATLRARDASKTRAELRANAESVKDAARALLAKLREHDSDPSGHCSTSVTWGDEAAALEALLQ